MQTHNSKPVIVKLGNRCALKLDKATIALFREFFYAIFIYLSPKVLHGQDCIKHKHMASKFNPGVKVMKKSQGNDYHLKKLFLVSAFLFKFCSLIFPFVQELPNVHNN